MPACGAGSRRRCDRDATRSAPFISKAPAFSITRVPRIPAKRSCSLRSTAYRGDHREAEDSLKSGRRPCDPRGLQEVVVKNRWCGFAGQIPVPHPTASSACLSNRPRPGGSAAETARAEKLFFFFFRRGLIEAAAQRAEGKAELRPR